ncbi:MAG: HEAT repeat domain-containing protein [bacterium]
MAEDKLEEKLEQLERNPFAGKYNPVDTILEGFYHSSEKLQRKAIRMAGAFPVEDYIKPLFQMVAGGNSLEVRRAAVETLGNFLHQGEMSDYHLATKDQIEFDSEDEMSGLSVDQFKAIRDFLETLVAQEDWPEVLRAEALKHYAPLAPDEAATRAEQFYNSTSARLRLAALGAISRIDRGNWTSIIMQEMRRQENDERKMATIHAAGRHKISEAGPDLVKVLTENTNKEFRRSAIEALASLEWPEAEEYLKRYTDDEDDFISKQAQRGLIKLREE